VGVSASFTVAKPKMGAGGVHSITELVVESADQNKRDRDPAGRSRPPAITMLSPSVGRDVAFERCQL